MLWGPLAGIVASLGITRLARGLLFGVTPADPATFAAAGLTLAAIALRGCLMPAWRAASVNPIVALRRD